jgi:hypothetical protein
MLPNLEMQNTVKKASAFLSVWNTKRKRKVGSDQHLGKENVEASLHY